MEEVTLEGNEINYLDKDGKAALDRGDTRQTRLRRKRSKSGRFRELKALIVKRVGCSGISAREAAINHKNGRRRMGGTIPTHEINLETRDESLD